jgi:hypothetical protein
MKPGHRLDASLMENGVLKYDLAEWTGFIWLRIETRRNCCDYENEPAVSSKVRSIFYCLAYFQFAKVSALFS